ncbi:hypothetical protein EDC94DRAFT_603668 [Helicostylum pulchrum]|nr:hypothetical protein EDC94DRAFT_603668 [Helicostylum pulchrum]
MSKGCDPLLFGSLSAFTFSWFILNLLKLNLAQQGNILLFFLILPQNAFLRVFTPSGFFFYITRKQI